MTLATDYAPPHLRVSAAVADIKQTYRDYQDLPIDQEAMEREITDQPRLDTIAELIRTLTYGEMIEFATAIWRLRPEGDTIGEADLPKMFHTWSTTK